jgi:hypothetical protein
MEATNTIQNSTITIEGRRLCGNISNNGRVIQNFRWWPIRKNYENKIKIIKYFFVLALFKDPMIGLNLI